MKSRFGDNSLTVLDFLTLRIPDAYDIVLVTNDRTVRTSGYDTEKNIDIDFWKNKVVYGWYAEGKTVFIECE